MIYNKFIIEDNNLILGRVEYHKELVTDETLVCGGGWFTIKNDIIRLYGDSFDFGQPTLEDIKNCIENNNVYFGIRNITDKYTFNYEFYTD